MQSLFSSRALGAAASFAVLVAGCGIDVDGVGVSSGGPGGSGPVAGRGGAGGSAAGRGGSAPTAGMGGTGSVAGGAGSGGAGATSGAGTGGGSGKGGASGKGGTGASGASGKGGVSGTSGAGGVAGADAGSGGTSVGGGGLGGGASGVGGAAGDGGGSGTAGAAGTSGLGGSAGNAGQAGGGGTSAGGGGSTAGASGAAGSGGAAGQGPVRCGNGHLDPGEACDDGSGTPGSTACSACQLPCETGGLSTNGRCYFQGTTFAVPPSQIVQDVRAQRAGATATLCAAEGAHLASLGDAVEDKGEFLDALGDHFGTTGTSQLLVGVVIEDDKKNSSNKAGDWIWIDGTRPTQPRWAPNNPDADTAGAGCGTLMGKRLNDLPCDSGALKGYLCEREPTCAVRTTPDAAPLTGYLGADGHCWIALPTPVSWAGALVACTSLKFLDGTGTGSIALFTTKARLDQLPGVGLFESWVGARQADDTDENTEAKRRTGWTWLVGGEAYFGLEAMWEPNKPNDKGGNGDEDFATLTNLRLLDDDAGSKTKRPLCEITP